MMRVDERPPLGKLILLGLQYAVLGFILIVVMLIISHGAGLTSEQSVALLSRAALAIAVGTALQCLWKGPIGSGFLIVALVSVIYLRPSLIAASIGGLPLVYGMTLIAGLAEMLFSQVLQRLRWLFPPVIAGLVIALIGLDIGLLGVGKLLDVQDASPPLGHFGVVGITVAIMIVGTVWGRGLIRLLSTFIAVIAGTALALVLGLLPDKALAIVGSSSWIAWPSFEGVSYAFNFDLVVPFAIVGLTGALRSIGLITTCQEMTNPNWHSPDMKTIRKGVLADGLGGLFAGLLGSVGTSTSASLVGVSQSSGAFSRYIGFVAAAFTLAFAFLPKLLACMTVVPGGVVGSLVAFTGSFMFMSGLQVIVSRNIAARDTLVVGGAILMGLSRELFSHWWDGLSPGWRIFTSTPLSVAIITALLLNLLFRIGLKARAQLSFDGQEVELGEVSGLLKQWKLSAPLRERIASAIGGILSHLQEASLARGPVKIAFAFDQIDFHVRVDYEGELVSLPFLERHHKTMVVDESATYGLGEYVTDVFPDRINHQVDGERVVLDMVFHA